MTCATSWTIATVWEGASLKVMARVYDINNTLITQASLSTIKYRVVTDGVEIIALTALTVANVVFDTLQTSDASWTKDTTGYNFKYTFPPATFPTGDVTSYVPIEFTDTASVVSILPIKVTVKETYIDTPA